MTATRRSQAVVTAVAILYVLIHSSTLVAIKAGVKFWPPMALATARFLIASAVMAALARLAGVPWPANRRAWMRLSALGALNMMIPAGLNFLAMRQVSVGTAAIAMSTNPLLLAVVAARLLGERLTVARTLGVLAGFGGVVYVMIVRVGAGGRVDSALGVLLLLSASASMVAGTVFFKRFPPREHLLVVNMVQQGVSGLLLLLATLLTEKVWHATVNLTVLGALLYMVLVTSIGGALLWFWLLARGEATVVSAFYFLSPISGIMFGALLFGDHFGARELVGMIIVSLGIVLVRRPR